MTEVHCRDQGPLGSHANETKGSASLRHATRTMCFALFAALLIAATSCVAPSRLGSSLRQRQHKPDSPPDHRLVLVVSEFHAAWQRAWRDGEEYRRLRDSNTDLRRRYRFTHCEKRNFDEGRDQQPEVKYWGRIEPYYTKIESARSNRGWCPSWTLTATPPEIEEATTWLDGALRPSFREGVARQRQALIAVLDSAFLLDRTNDWLVGHLTRFAVDARDFARARDVVMRCQAAAWWCAGLAGFTFAYAGDVAAADSSFAAMRRAMTDRARCEWEDASPLLPDEAWSAYQQLTCAERDSVHATLWWLADPLLREPGNARLVEQEVRRMQVALRRATMQDERFTFDESRGGDATVAALTRYGFPSFAVWLGVGNDRNWSYQGLQINHGSPPSPPYPTLEYEPGRVSTIPNWRAVVEPFSAVASDWQLGQDDSTGAPATDWWPREHFRPERRLVSLPPGQTVSVRRQSYTEVATAITLTHQSLRPQSMFDVLLLSSSRPTRVDTVDQQRGDGGSTVRLRGRLTGEPVILAIEAAGGAPRSVDARTRFAYVPPQPLAALKRDEIVISDIALLAPLSGAVVSAPSDLLLQYLLGSTTLAAGSRRVTLYWETYNTTPRDSADIALRIVREADDGLLRRMGVAARLISDPSRGLEIQWRDHESRGGTSSLAGPVPAQMRAITLDLSALAAGRYTIDIRTTLRDGRTVSRQSVIGLAP